MLERAKDESRRVGFDNTDVMYLITPDRFANGNPDNDAVDGMRGKPRRGILGGLAGLALLGSGYSC